MTASPDKVAEILFQHYRDSREIIDTQLRLRMYIAAGIFAALSAFAIEILDQAAFQNIAIAWIANAAHSEVTQLDRFWVHHTVTSLLWFLLCSLIAQVLSRTAVISREARYMLVLEERLSKLIGEGAVTRITQFRSVPDRYIDRANRLYTLGPVMPTAVLAIVKISTEMQHAMHEGFAAGAFAAVDALMFCILAYSIVQFMTTHAKRGAK
ncbi:MAG: hypothetical protein EXQ52_16035 [Bryobacterales bacterium]|nr:hypothetical protein [Bryobacterales bacterium]